MLGLQRPERRETRHRSQNCVELEHQAISNRPVYKFGAGEGVPKLALPEL